MTTNTKTQPGNHLWRSQEPECDVWWYRPKKKKKIQPLPLHTRPQVPSSAPLFVLAPGGQRLKPESTSTPCQVEQLTWAVSVKALSYQTPICWLLSPRKREPDHFHWASTPHVPMCREKGRFIPPSGAFTTNNSQVAARSLFR